jgi:enterobacterial common antigen flippase
VALGSSSVDAAAPAPIRPLQAIVALGGIQALTMLAGLARTKVLAVTLGPGGVGVASVIDQAVALVAQLGSLSVPFAALKYLSRARDSTSTDLRRVYTAFVLLVALASTLCAAIATALSMWQPGMFGDGLAPYRLAVTVALLGVPPIALAPVFRNVMAALGRHRESAVAAFCAAMLTVAGAYFGVRYGGLVGLYVANAIVTIVTIVGMHAYLSRSVNLQLVPEMRVPDVTRELRAQPGLVSFAGAMYVLALTSPLAYLLARSLLLSTRGEIEAGWVAAAYGLAVSVRLVLNQANGLYLTPLVNRATAKSVRTEAVAEYLRILIVLVVIASVAIAMFPHQWLVLLYSRTFLDAAPLVVYFLLAESVLLIAGVYQALLIGFDDIAGFLACSVAGHLVTIALAWWLVPSKGGMGVALGFLAGNSVILVATAVRLLRAHEGRPVFVPLVPLVLALAAIGILGWWAAGQAALSAGLRIVMYVGAVGLAFVFLRPDERRWLVRPWRYTSGPPRP